MSELDWSKWPNFSKDEMRCKETGECKMDEHFMNRLQGLRRELNRPLPVGSGYRDPSHSAEVNKEHGPGSHAAGHAVDIDCAEGGFRYKLIEEAIHMGFTGIGVAKTFVHLDDMQPRPHAPRPWAWSYS